MMLNIQKHLKIIPINLCFGDKLRMTNVVKSKLLGACKVNIIFRPPKKKNLTCTIFFFLVSLWSSSLNMQGMPTRVSEHC